MRNVGPDRPCEDDDLVAPAGQVGSNPPAQRTRPTREHDLHGPPVKPLRDANRTERVSCHSAAAVPGSSTSGKSAVSGSVTGPSMRVRIEAAACLARSAAWRNVWAVNGSTLVGRPPAEFLSQRGLFAQGLHCGPECVLDIDGLLYRKAALRPRMPDAATVTRQGSFAYLEQRATAVWARHLRRLAWSLRLVVAVGFGGGHTCLRRRHPGFCLHQIGSRYAGVGDLLSHKPVEQLGDPRDRQHVLHHRGLDRRSRHVGTLRIVGILHHSDTTPKPQSDHAGRAVVHRAGKYDSYNPGPERRGGRSEENVDRWPMPVLPWAVRENHLRTLDGEVAAGLGDHDRSRFQAVAVLCLPGRQRSRPIENARQRTGSGSGHVQDDQNGAGKVGVQARDQCPQRFHATSGGTDHDDIALGHGTPPETAAAAARSVLVVYPRRGGITVGDDGACRCYSCRVSALSVRSRRLSVCRRRRLRTDRKARYRGYA